MQKLLLCIAAVAAIFWGWVAPNPAYAEGFTLTSPDISGQIAIEQVFSGFGCTGENISPELHWENAPAGTKSFAVTAYDPDAPTGGGWWHWLIFDIAADAEGLVKNAGDLESGLAPAGSIQTVTSYGALGFGGACPPPGDRPHLYLFTVYALPVETLGIDATATPAVVGYYLNAQAIAKASVAAYYAH